MTTLELLKTIYADSDALAPNLHPDFKLYSPGQNLVAGVFDGLEGMFQHVGQMNELADDGMSLEGHTFLADENWGLAVSHVTAERNGKKLDVQGLGIWRFKDGKLYKHWEAVSDPDAWDDFWS